MKNFKPLGADDMDPMFQALTANEMANLSAMLESAYQKQMLMSSKTPRGMQNETHTLCTMIQCDQYMKYGL